MVPRDDHINIEPRRLQVVVPSSQPYICKEEENGDKERKPCAPADACSFGHSKHSSHISSYADARTVKPIVEVCNSRSISDLVADSNCDLMKSVKADENIGRVRECYIFQHLDFRANSLHLRIVLRLERLENGVRIMAPRSKISIPAACFTDVACRTLN